MGENNRAPVSVPITTTGDPSGIRTIQTAFGGLFQSLKLGFGIDIARRLTEIPSLLAQHFKQAVRVGIDFNATMETSELGIAAVLKATQPDRFQSFNAALSTAGSLMDALKEKATKVPGSLVDLIDSFQVLTGTMAQVGITDLSKQLDLTTAFSIASGTIGLPSNQVQQEARGLLEGNINRTTRLANVLGITSAEVSRWKEMGVLWEKIMEALDPFVDAGDRAANTWKQLVSNLVDVFQQAMGEATEGLFATAKEQLKGLKDYVESEEFKTTAKDAVTGATEVGWGMWQFAKGFMAIPKWAWDQAAVTFRSMGTLFGKLAGGSGGDETANALFRSILGTPEIGGSMAGGRGSDGDPGLGKLDPDKARAAYEREVQQAKWMFDQHLIGLEEYLAKRQQLFDTAVQWGELFVGEDLAKERQELNQETFKVRYGSIFRDAARSLDAGVIEPTGLAAKGIYTGRGESGILDRQVSLQTRMVDLMEQIRDELRAKLQTDAFV